MKTKNMRRFASLLLALVLALSLSVSAFAADAGTATLEIKINGTDVLVSTVDVGTKTTVYDLVMACSLGNTSTWTQTPPDADYSPLRDEDSVLYDPTAQALIMTSLDGRSEVKYDCDYDEYSPEDTPELNSINSQILEKYPESGGLGMYYEEGIFFTANMQYMVYVGYDWTYTVNGSRPGVATGSSSIYDGFFEYYMNEAQVKSGDDVQITYGLVGEVITF